MKTRLIHAPILLVLLAILAAALPAAAQAPDGSGPVIGLQRITLALQNDTAPKADVPMPVFGKALVAALEGRGFSVVSSDTAGAALCVASVTSFEEKPAAGGGDGQEFSMRVKMDISRPGLQGDMTSSVDTMKFFPAERVEADRAACLEEFFRQAAEAGAKNLSFHLPPGVRASSPLGDAFATRSLPGPDGEGIGEIFAEMLESMRQDGQFLTHYEKRVQEIGRLPRIVPGGLEGPPHAARREGEMRIAAWLSASGLFEIDAGDAIDRARRLLDGGTPAERSGEGMPDYFLSGTLRHSSEDGCDTWHFSLSLRDFATGRGIWKGLNVRSDIP